MSTLDLETSIANWEETAVELLRKDPSNETRAIIEQHTEKIYEILKNKIAYGEEKLLQEIKVEEEAIQTLKGRIKESQQGTSSGDDTYLFDAKTLYQSIKDQEWCEAYEILAKQTKDSENVICAILIDILKECYTQCDKKIQSVCEEIKQEIASPGLSQGQNMKETKQKQQKQKSKDPDELSIITDEFLKKTGPGIFPYHKQTLIEQVTTSKKFKPIGTKDKATENALESYITKCLAFCWIQILENKDVKLEDKLKPLSKIMPKYKKVPESKFIVTWPALVDKGCIVVDARYENKGNVGAAILSRKEIQLKPKGKDIKEETKGSIEEDIIAPVNNNPKSKGNNRQQVEANKTKQLNSEETGEGKHKLTGREAPTKKSEHTGRDAPAQKPIKKQEEHKLTGRDAPTKKSEHTGRDAPAQKPIEKQEEHKLTGRDAPTKKSEQGKRQNPKAEMNLNF